MSTGIGEQKTRAELQNRFKTREIPTETDFADVFESFLNLKEDPILGVLEAADKRIDAEAKQLSEKVVNLETAKGSLSTRVGNLETTNGSLTTRVGNLETTNGSLSKKVENLEGAQKDIDKRAQEKITILQNIIEPPRAFHSSVVCRDRIFVMGGTNDNENLDQVAVYSEKADLLSSLSTKLKTIRYEHSSVVSSDGKFLYIIGGIALKSTSTYLLPDNKNYSGSYLLKQTKDIEVYRIDQKGIYLDKESNLIQFRNRHTSEISGNKIYIIGGVGENNSLSKSIEVWITQDGILTFAPQFLTLSAPRAYHSSVFYKDKIYVIGGQRDDNGIKDFSKSIEIIDVSGKPSTIKDYLKHGRNDHSSVIVGDRIYVIGGLARNGKINYYHRNIEILQIPAQGDELIHMGHAELKIGRAYHTSVVIGKKIYVIGGMTGDELGSSIYGTYTNDIEILDTETIKITT